MEVLRCPLCCGNFFDSRKSLIEHLSKYSSNIHCPICVLPCPDISTLINHINNCASNKLIEIDVQCDPGNYETKSNVDVTANQISVQNAEISKINGEAKTSEDNSELPSDYLQVGVSDIPNYPQLELFNDNGESFVIVDETGTEYHIKDSSHDRAGSLDITTKESDATNYDQPMHTEEMLSNFMEVNNPATELFDENGENAFVLMQPPCSENYSLPHIQVLDPNTNSEAHNATLLNTMELDVEDNQAGKSDVEQVSGVPNELFSCTTCGVSFESVIKHIQDFHNNQDVVVEMNGEIVAQETKLQSETPSISHTQSAPEKIDLTVDPPQAVDMQEPIEQQNESSKDNADESSYKDGEVDIDDPASDNVDDPGEMRSPEQTNQVKRFITETGQIETMIVPKEAPKKDGTSPNILKKTTVEKVLDSKGRIYTRKLVEVGKFWKEKPPPKKKPESNKTKKMIFHQTVEKVINAADGSGKMKIIHCVACGVYVKSIEDLKDKPCKNLKYKCTYCPVSYQSAKSLCAHMKVHKALKAVKADNKDNGNNHFCDICCTLFASNKSLRLHVRMHEPVKLRQVVPPHLINADDKMNYYDCNQCHESIPLSYKDVHDEYHQTSTQYVCCICNRMFVNEENLIMHMSIHNTEKAAKPIPEKSLPYTCIYCYKQFSRPHEKVKHERIHTGEKPHKCALCGKAFRIAYCLTLHMRTHSGDRPYKCKDCGKRFKAHSVFNHHILSHSEVRNYKCSYCPKAFKTSVLLNAHKNSHTKPFACTVCNRRFSSLYSVRKHMEQHQKDNKLKYACTICGAIYARKFALRDHIKLEHVEEATGNVELLMVKAYGKTDDLDEIVYSDVTISKGKTMPVLED